MWQRRCEQTICLPAFTAVRAGAFREMFKTRGTHSFLVPEQEQPSKDLARSQMEWLEAQMTAAGTDYIGTSRATVVDIQLFCVLRFVTHGPDGSGGPLADLLMKDLPWVNGWYTRMSESTAAAAQAFMMNDAEKGAMIEPQAATVPSTAASASKALEGATYYTFPPFPSPGVPEAFAAEIGCLDELKGVHKFIDAMAGENRSDEFKAINPMGEVPVIKFADGTLLSETIAICQFLEESGLKKTEGPSLFGTGPMERAIVVMWQRRCEQTIILPAFTYARAAPFRELFKSRGTHSFLVPEQAEPAKNLARSQLEWIDKAMAGNEYICTGKCTVVDIHLFIVLRFVTKGPDGNGGPIPDLIKGLPWVEAWFERMAARPCAGATAKMMEPAAAAEGE